MQEPTPAEALAEMDRRGRLFSGTLIRAGRVLDRHAKGETSAEMALIELRSLLGRDDLRALLKLEPEPS